MSLGVGPPVPSPPGGLSEVNGTCGRTERGAVSDGQTPRSAPAPTGTPPFLRLLSAPACGLGVRGGGRLSGGPFGLQQLSCDRPPAAGGPPSDAVLPIGPAARGEDWTSLWLPVLAPWARVPGPGEVSLGRPAHQLKQAAWRHWEAAHEVQGVVSLQPPAAGDRAGPVLLPNVSPRQHARRGHGRGRVAGEQQEVEAAGRQWRLREGGATLGPRSRAGAWARPHEAGEASGVPRLQEAQTGRRRHSRPFAVPERDKDGCVIGEHLRGREVPVTAKSTSLQVGEELSPLSPRRGRGMWTWLPCVSFPETGSAVGARAQELWVLWPRAGRAGWDLGWSEKSQGKGALLLREEPEPLDPHPVLHAREWGVRPGRSQDRSGRGRVPTWDVDRELQRQAGQETAAVAGPRPPWAIRVPRASFLSLSCGSSSSVSRGEAPAPC